MHGHIVLKAGISLQTSVAKFIFGFRTSTRTNARFYSNSTRYSNSVCSTACNSHDLNGKQVLFLLTLLIWCVTLDDATTLVLYNTCILRVFYFVIDYIIIIDIECGGRCWWPLNFICHSDPLFSRSGAVLASAIPNYRSSLYWPVTIRHCSYPFKLVNQTFNHSFIFLFAIYVFSSP